MVQAEAVEDGRVIITSVEDTFLADSHFAECCARLNQIIRLTL
jgi:hypothetical protein